MPGERWPDESQKMFSALAHVEIDPETLLVNEAFVRSMLHVNRQKGVTAMVHATVTGRLNKRPERLTWSLDMKPEMARELAQLLLDGAEAADADGRDYVALDAMNGDRRLEAMRRMFR